MTAPEDQQRLRWLREDLASCLGQIGAILRRDGGEFDAAPAACIAIDGVALSAELEPAIPALSQASITWTWSDGRAVRYDWHTEAISRVQSRG